MVTGEKKTNRGHLENKKENKEEGEQGFKTSRNQRNYWWASDQNMSWLRATVMKNKPQIEELKNGRKGFQGIKSKNCWLFLVSFTLHELSFNLPWKTNEDFRIHEQANWGLTEELVDLRGQTQQKPTAYEWQGALQKDDLWFKVQFPKEQFFVKLSRASGTFPEVQMYLSSGKLRLKASPPWLLLLPCHTDCSSCVCLLPVLWCSRLWVASLPASVQLSRGALCFCVVTALSAQVWCHHNTTGSSCALLVLSLSHWG